MNFKQIASNWESHSSFSINQSKVLFEIDKLIKEDDAKTIKETKGKNNVPEAKNKTFSKNKGQINLIQNCKKDIQEKKNKVISIISLSENLQKDFAFLKGKLNKSLLISSEFSKSCGNMMKDQRILREICTSIEENLKYFRKTEFLIKEFEKNGKNLLNDKKLNNNLTDLEKTIQFFSKNMDYLESEKHLNKLLGLRHFIIASITTQITNIINNLVSSNKTAYMFEIDSTSETDLNQLLDKMYVEIQFHAKIKELFELINYFATSMGIPQYEELLRNIQAICINNRSEQILTIVTSQLRASGTQSLPGFLRNIFDLISKVISRESDYLYTLFFDKANLVKNITKYFIDFIFGQLRPIIIKTADYSTLLDSIAILSKLEKEELYSFPKYFYNTIKGDIQERLLFMIDKEIIPEFKSFPLNDTLLQLYDSDESINENACLPIVKFALGFLDQIKLCLSEELFAKVASEIIYEIIKRIKKLGQRIKSEIVKGLFKAKHFYYILHYLNEQNIFLISDISLKDLNQNKDIESPKDVKSGKITLTLNIIKYSINQTIPNLYKEQTNINTLLSSIIKDSICQISQSICFSIFPKIMNYIKIFEGLNEKSLKINSLNISESINELLKPEIIESNIQESFNESPSKLTIINKEIIRVIHSEKDLCEEIQRNAYLVIFDTVSKFFDISSKFYTDEINEKISKFTIKDLCPKFKSILEIKD